MGTLNENKVYVVQTSTKVIQRCILMATDPETLCLILRAGLEPQPMLPSSGDVVGLRSTLPASLSHSLGPASWGQNIRSIFSPIRVTGKLRKLKFTGRVPTDSPVHGDVRQGFVYERVPHITLKSIANNAEIDVIWEQYQGGLSRCVDRLTQHSRQLARVGDSARAVANGLTKAKALHRRMVGAAHRTAKGYRRIHRG